MSRVGYLAATLLAICFVSSQAHAVAESCVTALEPASLVLPVAGTGVAGATVKVLAPPGCDWTVTMTQNFGSQYVWYGIPWPMAGTGPGSIALNVMPNQDGPARGFTLVIGGLEAKVVQPANQCPLTVSPVTIPVPANGGAASFTINTTGSNCSYEVITDDVSVTSGASGNTFPATVRVMVSPNTAPFPRRLSISATSTGVAAFAPLVSIEQAGSPVSTDAPSGGFAFAVHRLPAATQASPAEPVRITNAEDPLATWTGAVDEPWLSVSPASGAGPGTIRIGIDVAALSAYGTGSYVGRVRILSSVAPQTPRDINITLRITDGLSKTSAPFGVIDIPLNNSTGLDGAFPIGGWAIDDVGIKKVRIYRNPIPMEFKGPIYLGDATRISGARPDVSNGGFPEANRAGWGFMLLSNVLPGEDVNGRRFYGSGTFVLSAVAEDFEGNFALIGQTRVTIDNATATLPFGTIDTPAQGGSAAGSYKNGGWVLAPPGRSIPIDGSTIRVIVDGAMLPNVATYNQPRADVASYFPPPTHANGSGPGAEFSIDTTQIADGLHTIAWYVIDALGAPQGIGSRFFTVDNGSASQIAGVESRSATAVQAMPQANVLVWDRKGFGEDQWKLRIAGSRAHQVTVGRGERVEVAFDTWWWSTGCGPYVGYLLKGDVAGPLPPGASVDGDKGVFSWLPAVEFAGIFDFVLVRRTCGGREMRIPLRVVIAQR